MSNRSFEAPSEASSKEDGLLHKAGSVGAATLLSRILGLVREQAIAILFGAGNATDAYNVAFRIPNLLRNLFAEGALSAAFVPVFTQTRAQEGDERAWRLAGLVIRVVLAFVSILTVFGIVFAGDLGRLYASSFEATPGKLELTVRMAREMFPYFPLVTLAAILMGILNAFGKFFVPALSSAFFNIVSVLTGVIFARAIANGYDFGLHLQPIEGMAIGVLFGGAVQALCQFPLIVSLRSGRSKTKLSANDESSPQTWYRDPALQRILGLMAPGVIGLAATQLSVLINTILATSQGPGAVSWLNYAFRLMQFPIGLFGVSIATAALPDIARRWVERDLRGLNQTLSDSLCHVFAVNLPASAGLAFLGYPIIELIFQYGRFQASDTRATALALAMYAVGLSAYSAVKILVPSCYAMGNARFPVLASMLSVTITLVLNWILMGPLGFSGLALGTSLGAIFNLLYLLYAVQKLLTAQGSSLEWSRILPVFFKSLFLSLVMGVAVYFSWRWLEGLVFGSSLAIRAFRVLVLALEGGALSLGLGRVLGLRELQEMTRFALRKIQKN